MSFSSKHPPGIERSGYSRWMNRLFDPAKAGSSNCLRGHAERRGDFGKAAAHQSRWSYPNHLIERPCQMRSIGEVRRVRCVRIRAPGADGMHGSGQLAPQHIAATGKTHRPTCCLKQMGETAGGREKPSPLRCPMRRVGRIGSGPGLKACTQWRMSAPTSRPAKGCSANVRSSETDEVTRASGTIVMFSVSRVRSHKPSLDSGSAKSIAPKAPLGSKE